MIEEWKKYWMIQIQQIYYSHNWKRNIKMVSGICDCWAKKEYNYQSINSGKTISCWCLRNKKSSERMKQMSYKDWRSKTRLYKIWLWIQARCRHSYYPHYKWKWIKCEWKTFEDFKKDMWPTYKEGLTIDRRDSDWSYCKDNCRWVTMEQQLNNTSRNKMITYKWKTQSLAMWCKELGLNYYTIRSRINILWKDPIEALQLQ